MSAPRTARSAIVLGIALALAADSARCHFLALIPTTDLVQSGDGASVALELSFMHPFEGERMDMAPPARVGVSHAGEVLDLGPALTREEAGPHRWYRLSHRLAGPGDYAFFVEPSPYWEPAEDSYIVHQTKVIVNAFGLAEHWSKPLGLTAEIVPLTRPYGLWAGNLLTARVLHRGEPVPHATVEVTLFRGKALIGEAPEVRRLQVVHADQNGVFSYAMPRPGWWGFSALLDDGRTLPGPDGQPRRVELGAVLWVQAHALD